MRHSTLITKQPLDQDISYGPSKHSKHVRGWQALDKLFKRLGVLNDFVVVQFAFFFKEGSTL